MLGQGGMTMYAKQPKKLLIMNILDILRKYSDEEHRLSQREIGDLLRNRYGMTADRKTIKRNLMDLLEYGFGIEYTERPRSRLNPGTGQLEENVVLTDFYLTREFTDAELRLLIDSLLFSRHLPRSQCNALVEKLKGLSSQYFRSHMKHVSKMREDQIDNRQLFLNIELLDEAIEKRKKVAFHYLEYRTDKRQHPRIHSDGSVREYVVSPYQMAAREGKYYLICNSDQYDDVANYRLDRICDLTLLKESIRPFETLKGADGHPLDLENYMKRHVYMYASGDGMARLRIAPFLVSDVIDLFGKDVTFSDEKDDGITVTVYANEMSIEQFAKSYVPHVTILGPEALRKKVKGMLEKALESYQD